MAETCILNRSSSPADEEARSGVILTSRKAFVGLRTKPADIVPVGAVGKKYRSDLGRYCSKIL